MTDCAGKYLIFQVRATSDAVPQRFIIRDMTHDVANDAAQIRKQLAQRPVGALELLGGA